MTKIHQDLVRRIWAVHKDVRVIRRNLDTFIEHYHPEVAAKIEEQEAQHELIQIPDSLGARLDQMLLAWHEVRRLTRPPSLTELADCFFVHLGKSTQPAIQQWSYAPLTEYLSLFKCQVLLDQMKDRLEYKNPPRLSHWPGYIDALQNVGTYPSFIVDWRLIL